MLTIKRITIYSLFVRLIFKALLISILNKYKDPPCNIDNMTKYIKLFIVYFIFLKEKDIIIIISPRIIFSIKKDKFEIFKNIIKPDKPPIIDPKINLSFTIFLFKKKDIPKRSKRSKKKLTKKT